ncbi:hypothetical protein [Pedobacter sp. MC2016-24]|uniref:hypothetical protein n=1 Tax=Pedobacter sp. MC2016-24 TaxID=2780090 RepID=UPI001880158B|nr:hypothetical protein [Pedobacter sp. MC2016-24]MBE9598033.1 hypothetical protein [Pedobacter sp. MC2016-24]
MIPKEKIRKLEIPFAIGYLVILLLVYFAGRNVLELYTNQTPRPVYIWVTAFMAPFVLYTTLRLATMNGAKWYGYIGYLVVTFFALVISGTFVVLKTDLLLSAALKPISVQQVSILEVKKVFQRKMGFDHTDVTILWNQQPLTFEARPNTFFLLEHKKTLQISTATSFLGNQFVTDLDLEPGERGHARWVHLKDWASRTWYVPAFFLLLVIGACVVNYYFPKNTQTPVKKIGFWKTMGIIMAVLFSIAIVLYFGLIIYVKFIA